MSWSVMSKMILRKLDGDPYLTRWRIVQTPWFRIFIHRLDASDPGVDLHDHPWAFASFILKGGYDEERIKTKHAVAWAKFAEDNQRMYADHIDRGHVHFRQRFRLNVMRRDECHRISVLLREPTWTLVFAWGRKTEWGFFLPTGYVPHFDYDYVVRREGLG